MRRVHATRERKQAVRRWCGGEQTIPLVGAFRDELEDPPQGLILRYYLVTIRTIEAGGEE
jgi:hypothetical protein